MTTSSEQRDQMTASALARGAFLLVVAWAGVGLLEAGVRLADAVRMRDALLHGRGWGPIVTPGADLVLGMLWLVSVGALALGAAVGAAALLLRGRTARAVTLVGLVLLGGVAQFAFIELDAAVGFSFSGTERLDDQLYAPIAAVALPVVVLVSCLAFLGPSLRRPRSKPAPAVAG